MAYGDYRHRVTIQTPAQGTADAWGATALTWADYQTCWAQIETAAPSEQTQGPKTRQQQGLTVRTHYIAVVTSKMRVRWGSRYFEIQGVENPNNMDRETVLSCSEVTT
jgi:SPP1 family predicted phage head-tail adaptor